MSYESGTIKPITGAATRKLGTLIGQPTGVSAKVGGSASYKSSYSTTTKTRTPGQAYRPGAAPAAAKYTQLDSQVPTNIRNEAEGYTGQISAKDAEIARHNQVVEAQDAEKIKQAGQVTTADYVNAGMSALQTGLNFYSARQQNKLARETFEFNKQDINRRFALTLENHKAKRDKEKVNTAQFNRASQDRAAAVAAAEQARKRG